MTLALVVVAALFALLLLGRLAGARRALLMQRWPSFVLLGAAGFALMRGQIWFALGLAGAAAISWMLTPEVTRRAGAPAGSDREDAAARAVLGVGVNATADEIRAAYRSKMAQAHPDRGGTHAAAAQLTAARDRLLKR